MNKRFIRLSIYAGIIVMGIVLAVIKAESPKQAYADSFLKFDEGGGTTASDTQNTASGTVTNATWKSDEYCISGKCLFFDGTGDYVGYGDNNNYDFAAAANFTIEFWFRHAPKTVGSVETILAKQASSAGYAVSMEGDGDITFAIDDDATWTPDDAATSTTATYDDNQWHFVTAVKTGTTKIELYIDGNLVATDSSLAASGTLVNSANFVVGSWSDGTTTPYTGFIDEMKIYTATARTGAQIKSDMIQGSGTSGSSTVSGAGNTSALSNGLVAYWRMDEKTGTTTADSSGNGNTSSAFSGNTTWAPGLFGSGLIFDGTDDILRIPETTSTDLGATTDSYSVSVWFKTTTNFTSTAALVDKLGASSTTYPFRIGLDSSEQANFSIRQGANTTTSQGTTALNNGVWHQIVAVRDVATSKTYLYVDGTLIDSDTDVTTSSIANNDDISIGNGVNATYDANDFNGSIDEVRIYNRALNAGDVTQLYSFAPGPLAYWKLDENTGVTANSSSSLNLPGTLTTGPLWQPGKIGQSVYFDGTDDFITMGNKVTIEGGSAATVCAWIKYAPASVTTDGAIVSRYSGSNPGWLMWIDDDGGYSARANTMAFAVDPGAGPSGRVEGAADLITSGTWDYYCGVFQGSTYIRLYKNGILNMENTSGVVATVENTDNTILQIGRVENAAPRWFNGNIDDVKIYNYARTPAQIIADMNGHTSRVDPPVGYWKFDEGFGDAAHDASARGNNGDLLGTCPGTSTCPTWTSNGKFDKALSFATANNQAVRSAITADNGLNIRGAITLSVWFKRNSSSGYQTLVDMIDTCATSASDGFLLRFFNTSLSFTGYINDAAGTDPFDFSYTNAVTFADTTNWHHALATWDGTTRTNGVKIYIDGKLAAQTTAAATAANMATLAGSNVNIGALSCATHGFDGSIDEVKIYNYSFTDSQVKSEFNHGVTTTMGTSATNSSGVSDNSAARTYCPPGNTEGNCGGSNDPTPIGYWPFDENTGTTANSMSPTALTGTLTGSPVWAVGKTGSAVEYNGSSQYTNIPYNANLKMAGAQTISFWFKPTMNWNSGSGARDGVLLSESGNAADAGNDWSVFMFNGGQCNNDAGRLRFGTYGDNIQTNTATWTAGTWYHIEIAYTNSTNATIYVNGIPDNYAGDFQAGAIDGANNNPVTIGTGWFDCGSIYQAFAPAVIDDVRIYNYARTPAQVAWDFNKGGPVGWWKFDESSWTNDCSTNTAFDASGNGNHGKSCFNTLGPTTPVTGKFNNAAPFDATDDYFEMGDPVSLRLTSSGTIAAWIYPASIPSGFTVVLNKGNFGTGFNDFSWYFYTGSSNFAVLLGGASSYIARSAPITSFPLNTWTHIAQTWDGSNMRLYINGIQEGTAIAQTVTPDTTGSTLNIGTAAGNSGWVFDGKIDDVRMYNYALSQQQINLMMNQGSALKFGQ